MSDPDGTRTGGGTHGGGAAALVIGSLTVASRVLGLVRDILFAMFFFGPALDAFALAFTVPNLFRRLFGEGALGSVLVPAFVEKKSAGDAAGAARLASRALGALAVGLGGVSAAVVLASVVVALVAGTGGPTGLVAGLLAIVMPYVVLICGAAVLMAFLNASGHFAMPALAPVLLNVALIAVAAATASVWWLAAAVLVGGALQYLVQAIPAARRGLPLMPDVTLGDPELRKVARTLVPAVAGLAAFQVNILLDRLIAEAMIPGSGAVGSLFLGNRLMQLPLAVFAISISTSALPTLSAFAARKDEDGFAESLRSSASSILFWTIPSAVGLALLAEPVTALLFDRGSFLNSPGALPRTSLVVMFYAPGIVAFGLAGLYARACYARGDAGAVVRAGLWSVGVNLVLNVALVILFQHLVLTPGTDLAVTCGEAGLALASTAAGFVYLVMLGLALRDPARRPASCVPALVTPLAAGAAAALAAAWGGLAAAAELVRAVVWLIMALAAAFFGGTAPVYDPKPAWEWLWNVSTLPAAVCVGAFVALAVALGVCDRALWGTFLRTSLTALGMGVAANLVLSSLPPEGASYAIVVQRALAPVALGVGAYWFLAGIVAAPEYEKARATLAAVVPWRRARRAASRGPA